MGKHEITCSFCGRQKSEVNVLIAGITGHICDHCITQANSIIEEEVAHKTQIDVEQSLTLLRPTQIKDKLDEYVIGQDHAKRILSVAVYNHYKRLIYSGNKAEDDGDDVEIEKSNVILVGKTGTGKTLLAKTIARMLNVPFCIADATVLTEAGYVGEDVESILARLLQAADYDVQSAERGIVFVDEIDKIARKSDNPSITRDVSGEGVQQALLKLLEGSTVSVPPQGGRKHPEQKLVQVNTKNILFVCGGAFDGIETSISRRINTNPIGFSSTTSERPDSESILQYIVPADLKTYGLIPELIGRFPVLGHLEPLSKENLLRILTEPKNALIRQYVKLFEIDNIKLVFDKEVLSFIVDKAVEYGLGARGLRGICEAILNDAMFDAPSKNTEKTEGGEMEEFKVTLAYARRKFGESKMAKLKVA